MLAFLNRKKSVEYFFVIVGYLFCVLFLTYPLASNFTSAIAGDPVDSYYFTWNHWWFKKAIFELHTSPFFSDFLFYPYGFDAGASFENFIVTIPGVLLQFIFTPTVAYNILIVALLISACLTTYALIKYLVRDRLVSFLGGVMFGLSPYMLARAESHLNLLTTFAIPLFFLFLIKCLNKDKSKNIWLLAASTLLIALSSYYYLLFTVLLLPIFLLIWWAVLRTNKTEIKKHLSRIFSALLLAALFILPFSLPIIYPYLAGESRVAPVQEFNQYPADLAYFTLPHIENPIFGPVTQVFDVLQINENVIFVGFFELILLFFGILIRKKLGSRSKIWYWFVIFPFLFSLGSSLVIFGIPTKFPLPYSALIQLPFFSAMRGPIRMSVFMMLAITVIVSIVLTKLAKVLNIKPRLRVLLFLLFLLIILAERITPFHINKTNVSPFFHYLKEDKNSQAILYLPISTGVLPGSNYFQMTHQKKATSGLINHLSQTESTLDFFAKDETFNLFRCSYTDSPSTSTAPTPPEQLFRRLNQSDIQYIVIYKPPLSLLYFGQPVCRDLTQSINNYFADLRPFYEDLDITVYKTSKIDYLK